MLITTSHLLLFSRLFFLQVSFPCLPLLCFKKGINACEETKNIEELNKMLRDEIHDQGKEKNTIINLVFFLIKFPLAMILSLDKCCPLLKFLVKHQSHNLFKASHCFSLTFLCWISWWCLCFKDLSQNYKLE